MNPNDLDRVPASELDNYNPDRFDAYDNGDGTYRLVPLKWWDDASYADYQGDPTPDPLPDPEFPF